MECKGKVLIVDDNEDVLLSLNMLLRPWVDAIRVITRPERILEFMENFHPDVILLDMNFGRDMVSGEEGYEWLSRILEKDPASVVVLMTAYVDTEKTVRAIKAGAVDFVPKPWNNKKMLEAVHSAVDLRRSRLAALQAEASGEEEACCRDNAGTDVVEQNDDFVGESPQILLLKERIARVAKTGANVLITGENGVGKDVVAHELHRLSSVADRPFVSIDLGCIPEQLFESELFGHEKGAFTGASSAKAGRMEQADGGTLFLDEIGNLTPVMQQKLLTVIEKREISRIGSTKVKKINVRIIAATNANLQERVVQGTFREDLLYRLNTIELHVSPLRERGNDILLLANYFCRKYALKYNKDVPGLSREEQRQLMLHTWQGNVRELQHCMERRVIEPSMPLLYNVNNLKIKDNGVNGTLNLEELERTAIRRALEQSNGNMSLAAELLGITRYALYRKIDKHGI